MQDTLDVTSAGYEYDFTWMYILETGHFILLQWKDTTQVYNIMFLNNLLLVYTKMLIIYVDSTTLPS